MRAAAEATGLQDMQAILRDNRSRVRKGPNRKPDPDQGVEDDVGHIVLGDMRVNEDRPQKNGGGLAKGLLTGLLGASAVGVPLAGYLWSQRPDTETPVEQVEQEQPAQRQLGDYSLEVEVEDPPWRRNDRESNDDTETR